MTKPQSLSDRLLKFIAPAIVGALLLAGWEGAANYFDVPPYIFPKPSDIAQSLQSNWSTLISALFSTLIITLIAFAAAIILGAAIAFALVQNRLIEISFFPYVVLLQVTPVVAIAPLIIILVKQTQLALIICATIIALFPIISNTTTGLRSVERGHVNLFKMYDASRWQSLMHLRIPTALPYFFAGLRISSGLALVGAVVAEFIAGTGGQSAGLAYEIMQASFELDIARMFAALLLIGLTGVALFVAMSALTSAVIGTWHVSEAGHE